jgi:hypothetical protein
MKRSSILLILCSLLFLLIYSCSKNAVEIAKTESVKSKIQEEIFFNSYKTNNAKENAVVEFLKRANAKYDFVAKTVERIGLPH